MDIGGLTALHCAAGMGHTNVVRVLVSANATVDVKASGVVNWCNCRRDASVVCDTLL
jgi:ankyrin repeat protein